MYKVYMNISTRRKLINEIKDYDKNMNGRVADMQKRKIFRNYRGS
jgi:hypothetical protein